MARKVSQVRPTVSDERWIKMTECLLCFDADPMNNINRLTALCGDLLGADCVLYNRLYHEQLCAWGQWQAPHDFQAVDNPEGHICYDIIRSKHDEPIVIRQLPDSKYFYTDPNVKKYGLQTYIGKPVIFDGKHVGSLCALYMRDVVFDEDSLRAINSIAKAIGVEEVRQQANEALRKKEEKYRLLSGELTAANEELTASEKELRMRCVQLQVLEEALRTSGEQLSLAVELAHLGPWKYDPDTQQFEFGDEFYAIYGTDVTREGIFMTPDAYAREFVHPDDAWMVKAELGRMLSSSERHLSSHLEHRIIRRDGEVRTIVVRINVVTDAAGKIVKWYGANQDITEQTQAAEKIRRQNVLLTSLHETALVLMQRFNINEVLKMIIDSVMVLLGTSDGFVLLDEEEAGTFTAKVATGIHANQVGLKVNVTEGLLGKVYSSGQIMVIDNYNKWGNRLSDSHFDKIECFVEVPLKSDNKVVGVLGITYLEHGRTLAEYEVALLQRFADIASIAIDNARLYDSMQRELVHREMVQAALAASEEKFSKAFRRVADAIGIVRLSDGRYIEVNDAFSKILGYSREEIIGRTSAEIGLWCNEAHYAKIFEVLRTKGSVHEFEVSWRTKSGEIRVGLDSAEVIEVGGERCIVYAWHDITERKQAEERLRYLSVYDTLTDLYNRAFFVEELNRYQAKNCIPVAVIMCDTDGLKLVNDTLGHTAGDQLLVAAAEIIRRGVRSDDVSARIGGDEFAVILPGADEKIAQAVVERIRSEIGAYNQDNPAIPVSISIGYSVKKDTIISLRDVVKEADDHMYREKLNHSQSAHSDIVHTVVKLLEERDCMTDEHAGRLQELATKLALKLGLSESIIADIQLLAKYHDIGKIGVPDNILKAPGPLTENEKLEIRRHCEIGYRIARSSTELLPISSWILKHHEWWDGNGYPLGISGKEIPLECRIVAIVDAYDAMTSDQLCRKAMSCEATINELKRCAGTQFDPELVELFVSILNIGGANG